MDLLDVQQHGSDEELLSLDAHSDEDADDNVFDISRRRAGLLGGDDEGEEDDELLHGNDSMP